MEFEIRIICKVHICLNCVSSGPRKNPFHILLLLNNRTLKSMMLNEDHYTKGCLKLEYGESKMLFTLF